MDRLPECRHCWARYLCGGGCFYENLGHTGHMHRPDPLYCLQVKEHCSDLLHRWAGLGEPDRDYLRERIADAERTRDD